MNTSMFKNTRLGHWHLQHRCYLGRSGSELFDTFTNIILLRLFPLQNICSWKMLSKLKWQILLARYNWCQGPVLGRGPAVEKHWCIVCRYMQHKSVLNFDFSPRTLIYRKYECLLCQAVVRMYFEPEFGGWRSLVQEWNIVLCIIKFCQHELLPECSGVW
jgi:hypothetical protein